ncbi:MAG: hypothetical protein M3347_02420, partial [Armatimonadota bacterium]|nr:hypothetical protein [Armatimonadota bacterium]
MNPRYCVHSACWRRATSQPGYALLAMIVFALAAPLSARAASHVVLLGAYIPKEPWIGSSAALEQNVRPFDAWAGKSIALLGTFIDIDGYPPTSTSSPYNIVLCELRTISSGGYTPFVNLQTTRAITDLIPDPTTGESAADKKIGFFLDAIAQWQKEYPNRILLLAPLPEMNSNNEKYYGQPQQFRDAWRHLRHLGVKAGLTSKVRWVWAPNGYPD